MEKLWVKSPFFNKRGNNPLDMIVIHHIGSNGNGKLYGVSGTITWFTNIDVHRNKKTGVIENKVSAHYIIPREQYKAADLIQVVKDVDVAYHAGYSQWAVNNKLRKYLNKYSIGIELQGDGNLIEYTDTQYEILSELVKNLIKKYKIPEENIVGHEDVSPGRKVDPGKLFDWKRFRTDITKTVIPVPKPPAEEPLPEEKEPEVTMGGGEDKVGKPKNPLLQWILKLISRK